MAWAFTLAEPIIPAALYASFGLFGAAFITELTGFSNDMLWLPLAIICGLIVWFLIYRGIGVSTRTGVVLGVIEIGIFLVVAVLLVANAETPVNTAVFIPANGDFLPAFQGMVFCLLAFVGFEAAAPLGEETREPKRTIPRAVILSALLIGLFYIFCYYAATVYFGPDRMQADFLGFADANPWGGMAEEVLPGIGGLLVTFAIINSSLANANAGAIASTRSIFSLGRGRLLPGWFAAVHPVHRTPVNAVHFQGAFAIVLAVLLGLLFQGEATGGPLTTYVFIGYALGLLFAGHVHRGQRRRDRLLPRRAARRVQRAQAPRRADPRRGADDPGLPLGARRPDHPDPGHPDPGPHGAVQLRAAAGGRLDGRRDRALLLAALEEPGRDRQDRRDQGRGLGPVTRRSTAGSGP